MFTNIKEIIFMASTKAEERYARKYYKENKSYRKKKIADTAQEHKRNRTEHNKKAREYYHSNTNYRKYKIAYAKAYQKRKRGK